MIISTLRLKEKYREFETENRNREMVIWKSFTTLFLTLNRFSRYDEGKREKR